MLRLHIANKNYSSWSLRPWVLMRALGIPFEEVLTPFGASNDPRGFRAFSPTGKVPVLVDGETCVWDSLAILEYLAEYQAASWPVWPQERAARAWARSAAAEMHSGFATVRNLCSMSCGIRVKLFSTPPALLAEWARIAELWAEGLARFGGPFLAGSRYSAADAFYAPVVFRAQTYDITLPGPARDYCERMLALPAMRQWYEAALKEPWRDAEHEVEIRRAGEWIADLRVPER